MADFGRNRCEFLFRIYRLVISIIHFRFTSLIHTATSLTYSTTQLAETRGNNASYSYGGLDTITSALHWGPNSGYDEYLKTSGSVNRRRGFYDQEYYTYGLEWTEDYIITCE